LIAPRSLAVVAVVVMIDDGLYWQWLGAFCCQEEKQKVYRKEKRKDRKRRADDADLDDDVDTDMAVVMGFSGFGTSKK